MLRLTKLREAKGWSRSELARRAAVGIADISRIESGRMLAYRCQAERIAHVLGVRVEELFDANRRPLEADSDDR